CCLVLVLTERPTYALPVYEPPRTPCRHPGPVRHGARRRRREDRTGRRRGGRVLRLPHHRAPGGPAADAPSPRAALQTGDPRAREIGVASCMGVIEKCGVYR